MRTTSPLLPALVVVAALGGVGLLSNCGMPTTTTCSDGSCSDAGLVINELAGSGGDFVELFNASDKAADLSEWGLTDADDAGVRYATALRFANGVSVAPRGYLTIFLNNDPCPSTISPCVSAPFGIGSTGDTITLLDVPNNTVQQQEYPANAAPAGSSLARKYDGAPTFEVQRRSPGAKNAP